MRLILPGVAQRRKPRLQRHDLLLEVGNEPLQLLGETPHLFGIHDCLGHSVSFCLCLWLAGAPGAPQWRLRLTQTCPVPARSANLNHIGCSPGLASIWRRPLLPGRAGSPRLAAECAPSPTRFPKVAQTQESRPGHFSPPRHLACTWLWGGFEDALGGA